MQEDSKRIPATEISPPTSISESSDEDNSIYTIYLHGPRFIIPLYHNNNYNLNVNSSTVPRSSWPSTVNDSNFLSPLNGLSYNKYIFKSEPKLLNLPIDCENQSRKSSLQNTPRKNSKTEFILSVLRHPVAFLAEKMNIGSKCSEELCTPRVARLNNQYCSSSVPDLWAVKNNSPRSHREKKNSDSSVLVDKIGFRSIYPGFGTSMDSAREDPVLKFMVTSDESPYL